MPAPNLPPQGTADPAAAAAAEEEYLSGAESEAPSPDLPAPVYPDLGGNPYGREPYTPPPAPTDDEVDAKVAADVLDGLSPRDAVLRAGLPARRANAVMARPAVRSRLVDALEAAGVTDRLLTRVIRSGLGARRPITHEGAVISQVPDHSARHKYLETVLDLRGDREKKDDSGDSWEAMILAVRAKGVGRGA